MEERSFQAKVPLNHRKVEYETWKGGNNQREEKKKRAGEEGDGFKKTRPAAAGIRARRSPELRK